MSNSGAPKRLPSGTKIWPSGSPAPGWLKTRDGAYLLSRAETGKTRPPLDRYPELLDEVRAA